MNNINKRILASVQKPARYTGGEYNAVVKKAETYNELIKLARPELFA